jgi:hypothetical protein
MQRQKQNKKKLHKALLSRFTPPLKGIKPKEGEDKRSRYAVEDYYGVGLMPYKKDDNLGIALFYDYSGKRSITSNTLKVPNDNAFDLFELLNMFRKTKTDIIEEDIDLESLEAEVAGSNTETDTELEF